MAVPEYTKRAIKKYNKTHYEHMNLRLNIGDKDRIKKMAEESGKSQNQFILDCIFGENK